MFFVYIIKSVDYDKYYIGITENIEKRINRHNQGGSVWTNRYKPWELAYSEEYQTKTEALRREIQIKKYKGGNAFRKLIMQR